MKIVRFLAVTGALASAVLVGPTLRAAALIEVSHHQPCNLFDVEEPVKFVATFNSVPPGAQKATITVTGFFQETKTFDVPLPPSASQTMQVPIELGKPGPGYYEMNISVAASEAKSEMVSFGVVRFQHRTAAEALAQGSRFGLKTFQIDDIWWRRPLVWNLGEVVDACTSLGLQWTRHQFNQEPRKEPGLISTRDLIEKHAMNVVLKIEGFPENCYDTARYGPLEEWKVKHKGKNWSRCTVPLKEPYQEWLKRELLKIPAGQNIFEVGNEVWNYMKPEEFAEWTRMVTPVVLATRPGAKVGGDPGSGNDFTHRFLKAAGMDGMTLWFDHPYSFTPLPEHRTRAATRNIRDILKRRTGHDFDLYISEYGWSVAPQDRRKQSVSEKVQAQRTTRQSLMLYAEDAKTLIPHWMGDREQDVTEREHFFGFFRLNQQPRPVVVAHAVCARMVDGSRFVGDLFLGEGIGAMLFEKSGRYTLALSTADDARSVEVDVGVPTVTLVDMMGGEKQAAAKGGKVPVSLDGGVTYLVGVDASLAKRAVPPSQDLNPDVWSPRKGTVPARHLSASPQIDGKLDEWKAGSPVALVPQGQTPPDARAETTLGWDDRFVYVAVRTSGETSAGKDVFEFNIGTRPSRQPDLGSAQIYDYLFTLTVSAADKSTKMVVSNDDFDQPLECQAGNDPSGIHWAIHPAADGWTGEIAVPISFLQGLPTGLAGAKASCKMALQRSGAGKKEATSLVFGDEKPRLWPYLNFQP